MAQALYVIWAAISSFMDLIVSIGENLVFFIKYLSKAFPVVLQFGTYVPTIIAAGISMVIATGLVKIIVGR